MDTTLIGGIVGTILTALIINAVFRSAQKAGPEEIEGARVLTYGRGYRITGIAGFVFFMALGFACLIFAEPEEKTVSLIFFGFALLSFALTIETLQVRIEFDDHGVRTRSPWRSARWILWEDFTDGARFSAAAQWCILPAGRHGKLRLSVGLRGLKEFLDQWSMQTGFELGNRKGLETYWNTFQ